MSVIVLLESTSLAMALVQASVLVLESVSVLQLLARASALELLTRASERESSAPEMVLTSLVQPLALAVEPESEPACTAELCKVHRRGHRECCKARIWKLVRLTTR